MNQIRQNSRFPTNNGAVFNIPGIVLIFIAGFCAVHIYRLNISNIADYAVLWNFGFIPNLFFYGNGQRQNLLLWLTPLSYAFLHGSTTHLVLNALWFLAFGSIVARQLGAGLFVVFFIITAVFASLVYGLLNINSDMPVIGASGAVSGAMAAALLISPDKSGSIMSLKAALGNRQVLATTLIWILINVVSGAGINPVGEANVQIAWEAHLAGFFCGLVAIGPLFWLKRH